MAAQVAVCGLAYLVEMVLEQKLARLPAVRHGASPPLTAPAALEARAPVQQVLSEVNGRQFQRVTDGSPAAAQGVRALGLDPPAKTVALDA